VPERHGAAIRGVCGVLWFSAIGRVLSIRSLGKPLPLFRALMAIEFAIPLVVMPWQALVARATNR
jgi:hypothetical protein